jgi:hypothetical protein
MLGALFEMLLTLSVPMGKRDKPAPPAVVALVLLFCVAFVGGLFALAYVLSP